MLPFALPPGLLGSAGRDPSRVSWVEGLPRLVCDVVEEWGLAYDGAPSHGAAALVVPVRTSAGRPAVLKVAWPSREREHEHLGLQALHGDGAVELYRADPRRGLLLLERLHAAEDLSTLWDLEACQVVAALYPRLHIAAPPRLRTLSSLVTGWNDRLLGLPRDAALPRRLVEQALALGSSFVADLGTDGTLVHADLHYANVLAADREPWLAIGLKPISGDPHYEVAPLLWSRWDDVLASNGVRDAVRRRFHTVVDSAELDEDRARDWVLVRAVHFAAARVLGSPAGLDADGREEVTRAVAIAKAVQG